MELKLEGISKSYHKNQVFAVKDFSKTFTPGVYGLLGPNGAGKSTLMNMITGNLKPDEGTILCDGVAAEKLGKTYRERLGYMPQQQNLYDNFTGEQFLWYMSSLKGLAKKTAGERMEKILSVVNLKEERYRKLKTYSGGMKQRILIAQALLNEPDILVMDEPTAGLDPKERIRIRNFISGISQNKIVLLATHVVPDVEYIAKEILILREGRLIRQGTPQELLKGMEDKVYEVFVTEAERREYEEAGVLIANETFTADKICLRLVTEQKPRIGEVFGARPNLEDVYLYYNP